MQTENCRVLANRRLADHFFELELHAPALAAVARPGQFAMLKTSATYDPFLKRPMGLSRITADSISFICQIKGRGTELLSGLEVGDELAVQGPLGNGWPLDESYRKVLLVAGGIGITPLMPLAESLAGCQVDLLWGVSSAAQLFHEAELRQLAAVQIATDDGSAGHHGLVSALFPDQPDYDMVYCCGPRPLLACVARWAEAQGLPCRVSLEERMGCGLGTCMGCVCDTKDGYKRVCCDGPVFDSREVNW